MERVIIALGSNIQPKLGHLKQAIEHMEQLGYLTINKQSTVYQTVPKGYDDQDDFYNMIVEARVDESPERLITDLLAIEQELKRVRKIKNGPRTIDLDVLLMDDLTSETETLIVPHPRMHERAFVLVPLAEISPDFVVPTFDETVETLKQQLPAAELADVESIGELDELLEQESDNQ